MQFAIAQVQEEDMVPCARVIRDSFSEIAAEYGLTEKNCPSNGAFIKPERLRFDRGNGARMYMLRCGDELCGFMQMRRRDGACFDLEKLCVLPAFRHRGGGTALLAYAGEQVMKLGASRANVGIIEENKKLRSWYESNGFIHDGALKLGHPFTVGLMHKDY